MAAERLAQAVRYEASGSFGTSGGAASVRIQFARNHKKLQNTTKTKETTTNNYEQSTRNYKTTTKTNKRATKNQGLTNMEWSFATAM